MANADTVLQPTYFAALERNRSVMAPVFTWTPSAYLRSTWTWFLELFRIHLMLIEVTTEHAEAGQGQYCEDDGHVRGCVRLTPEDYWLEACDGSRVHMDTQCIPG